MADLSNSTHASRRLFLAAGPASAVFAALGVAAAIPALDPVFAAIERHRAAWDAYGVTCYRTDDVLAKQQGREVTQADEDAVEEAGEFERQAIADLIETPPQTTAGMRAAIAHLIAIEYGSVPEMGGRFLPALLQSPLFAA
jgi:hypothetical protein